MYKPVTSYQFYLGRPPTSFETRLAARLKAVSRSQPKLQRATELVTGAGFNWAKAYGALLEIEFALGLSVDEAGFCSHDKREHFIGSATHHSILHVFCDRKMVIDVEAPKPMNVDEGYLFITVLLIQALSTPVEKTS